MKANDAWDIVTGASIMPGALGADANDTTIRENAKNIAAWKKLDALAQKVIATTIGAKAMWDRLVSVYEQKTETSIHMLQQKWFSAIKNPSDDMATHIARLEDVAHRLKLMGETISDSMIITKVLMTLPANYSHFVSAWESAPAAEQTLVNLTSRLTIEESRHVGHIEEESKALASRSDRGKGNQERNFRNKNFQESSFKGKCYRYDKLGHWAKNCPDRRQKDHSEDCSGSSQQEGKPSHRQCQRMQMWKPGTWTLALVTTCHTAENGS